MLRPMSTRIAQRPLTRLFAPSARAFSAPAPTTAEIKMLEQLLDEARKRAVPKPEPPAQAANGNKSNKFNIATFNTISPVGLGEFEPDKYFTASMPKMLEANKEPHVIMLRSHKLQVDEIPTSVRCVARCGAGVNNIPVKQLTELGIPVFNTPGANANAVKEAVICGLLLASRGIYEGIKHTQEVIYPQAKDHAQAAARIEKDKALFVGHELAGKTLGVIGLGQIGGRVVNAALALGMKVIGHDPDLSLEAAWQLPGDRVERAKSLEDLLAISDYISLHVPYMPATHHLIGKAQLAVLKPTAHIINFARAELVDSEELKKKYAAGHTGKYVSDFADEYMQGHPRMIMLPHLGASTEEAEENSAAMAANTIKDFVLTGAIRHSVNFPSCSLTPHAKAARLCIVNQNEPGVLGRIMTFLGKQGINIAQQINMSRGAVAYTVVDIESHPSNPAQLQDDLGEVGGILSSRFIGKPFQDELGNPGTFFKTYVKRQ